jgi:hypothetical protein
LTIWSDGYDEPPPLLSRLYETFVRDFFSRLGFPPESVKIHGFRRLSGSVASTFIVDMGGLKLVLKHDPETVPTEVSALKALSGRFPQYFPKLLHSDKKQGMLLLPYYPYPTLHDVLTDPHIPNSVKLKCFRRVYEVLNLVIYESSKIDGIPDPAAIHLKRINDRVQEWANREGMPELLKKRLKINGAEIEKNFLELTNQLMEHLSRFICRYKVITLGDEHPKNVLVGLSPPGSRIIFFDLPNVNLDGEDPAKGWGKVIHWLIVYGYKLYPLNSCGLMGEELDERVKEELKLEIHDDEDKIELNYELLPMPLASELNEVFRDIVRDFAQRVNDREWQLRLLLGWARADLGGVVHQKSRYLSLVLFAEGTKRLWELCRLLNQTEENEGRLCPLAQRRPQP